MRCGHRIPVLSCLRPLKSAIVHVQGLHAKHIRRSIIAENDARETKFTPFLPDFRLIRYDTRGARGGVTRRRERSGRSTAMTKILLAEDDTDMRRFLVKALQQAGYEVISYDNGLSAYQRLREEPFELLLTDIVMPEMDGIELARRAAELDPDIKIMFITGFAAVALNPDSSAPKHAKVLSKPFHLRDLVNEVQKVLAA